VRRRAHTRTHVHRRAHARARARTRPSPARTELAAAASVVRVWQMWADTMKDLSPEMHAKLSSENKELASQMDDNAWQKHLVRPCRPQSASSTLDGRFSPRAAPLAGTTTTPVKPALETRWQAFMSPEKLEEAKAAAALLKAQQAAEARGETLNIEELAKGEAGGEEEEEADPFEEWLDKIILYVGVAVGVVAIGVAVYLQFISPPSASAEAGEAADTR
jgi:hypothetical protein